MDGVSFIITVFDKAPYLPRVINALAGQEGAFEREFIFVDDGSTDGSAEVVARLTAGWSSPVLILRQRNQGASFATNHGAAEARLQWLRLVDGDDLLAPGSTPRMLAAVEEAGETLAYGDLGIYDDEDPWATDCPTWTIEHVTDGLRRFIRNCPVNSSCVLVAKERYRAADGCDSRLVSPDQALLLRLFAIGDGLRLIGPVAYRPREAPGRLSGQRRRSRYESVLALYYLMTETPNLDPALSRYAARRALSRAARFYRAHGGRLASMHLVRHLASVLGLPLGARAVFQALSAFTEDGRVERPESWLPGALRDPDPISPPQVARRSGGSTAVGAHAASARTEKFG
jgi:Glycosyl transferase family 2